MARFPLVPCSVRASRAVGRDAALETALRVAADHAPAVADRAERALAPLIRAYETSLHGEAAWSWSKLTADGYPVELAFVAGVPGPLQLRWVAEVAAPERPVAERLNRAIVLAHARDVRAPVAAECMYSRLLALQAGADLEYGAWLGGRHDARRDTYKVYAELLAGPDTDAFVRDCFGERPLLERGGVEPRMAGIDASRGAIEVYFRAEGMEPWEVARLLGRVGLAERAEALLALVEEIAGHSANDRLPCAARASAFVRIRRSSLSLALRGPSSAATARSGAEFEPCAIVADGSCLSTRRSANQSPTEAPVLSATACFHS